MGLLPDPKLTPGDILSVTTADICAPGYTKIVRAVPAAVKRQVTQPMADPEERASVVRWTI
jgi:hypothetical protein